MGGLAGMIAASEFLLDLGMNILSAGFYLWIILFFVALFRDPNRSELFGWSISAQWTAMFRILRRAAGFRPWGLLAKIVIALGVTCLLLSGLLAVISLFVNGPKG
ncbi:MAG: hypothetical protein ACT4OK_01955 [Gemmobacter sp.]